MASNPDNGDAPVISRSSRLYWICQFAGWGGYLAYVLGGYLLFADQHRASAVVSIVFFCVVVPPLMTHGLRAWMHRQGWTRMPLWPRLFRSAAAVLVFSLATTLSVGVLNGLGHGRLFVPTDGMGWMFLAYAWAFAGWLFIYGAVHARRRRDELELIARDAQLRSLRAQVNPHFLFNSLNSVRSLITEDPRRAASMLTGLSDILRYSLASDRRDTVSLADELGIIDEYVGLEQMRFEERLRIEQAIDPAALVARVPPMLVQTLVENAVKHGIADLPLGGLVRLEARARDGRVDIVVINSGRFKPSGDDSGYGLRNARERLRLLYGELASLTVREDGETTTAALSLPLQVEG
jgi:two-component system LytT family sensor kinase